MFVCDERDMFAFGKREWITDEHMNPCYTGDAVQ